MLVVGIIVIRANRLSGWQRFVPLLCSLWLLIAIVGSMAFGDTVGGFLGFVYAAVLWILLGYIVRGGSRQVGTAPEPAIR